MNLEKLKKYVTGSNIDIYQEKDVNHGKQISLDDGKNRIHVIFYNNGNIQIQGKDSILKQSIQDFTGSVSVTKKKKQTKEGSFNLDGQERIGIDESGKGDYFGPLVIASAFVKPEQEGWLREIGIIDSKKITDKKIMNLNSQLRKTVVYDLIFISPQKYNKLYNKIKNLNKLLAWGHARTLENILEKCSSPVAVSDKFGTGKEVLDALLQRGKTIKLIQETKAESDLAVATASIIARAEFLNQLKKMEKKYSQNFSKGISQKTIVEGREFLSKNSRDDLHLVAKLHFKTTEKL